MFANYDDLNSNLVDIKESVNDKIPKVRGRSGLAVTKNQWTTILSFDLDPGSYKIEWSLSINAAASSGAAIFGTRIQAPTAKKYNLKEHMSNQDNAISDFYVADLSDRTTIKIDFYHNFDGLSSVSVAQACVTPIEWF